MIPDMTKNPTPVNQRELATKIPAEWLDEYKTDRKGLMVKVASEFGISHGDAFGVVMVASRNHLVAQGVVK